MDLTKSDRELPIRVDPEVMSGVPVFTGTRVPVQTLFDYLAEGCRLTEFLYNFPTVTGEQARQVLDSASSSVIAGATGR